MRLVEATALPLQPGSTYAIEVPKNFTKQECVTLHHSVVHAAPQCRFVILPGVKLTRHP